MFVLSAMLLGGCPRRDSAPVSVRPGIDVLLSDSMHLVHGRRVGLVTNQTGVDVKGRSSVDRLREAGVHLVALYSPEHGFRGAAAPGEMVESTQDSATGLPIYSLYGANRAPTPAMLEGVEVMLLDLQDVGARYYTYVSTAIEVMRAAGAAGIPLIVLDRPNPIGSAVQGNLLDTAFRSFVGFLPVAMRHGMTIGELALLGREEQRISADVTVIPVAGWHRRMYLDETGLPFIPPSANLQSLESIIHYPGTCLFEGTNLSVGRGTPDAFSQIGSPWLDGPRVIRNVGPLAGVRLDPVAFTPRRPGDGKYSDTTLSGIRLTVTDRATYDPVATAARLLVAVRAASPQEFQIVPRQFDRLAGDSTFRVRLMAGEDAKSVMRGWDAQREAFMGRRAHILLYPD